MRTRRLLIRAELVAVLLLGGCARVNPQPDYEALNDRVGAATGVKAAELPNDQAALRAWVDARLADGLTAAEALEICLLNNPRVQTAYLRIGLARSDVVQAGLFRNPSVALALRLPDGGGLTNLQVDLAQRISDLWLVPTRHRAAEGELQRETLQVAREISIAVLDTRAAYYAALAADRELEIADENRTLTQTLVDTAAARQSAGVGSVFDVNLTRTEFMRAELAAKAAALTAFEARRHLAVLLGLPDRPDALLLSDTLPEAPYGALSAQRLVPLAQRSRLDLVAADYAVAAAAARIEQEKLSVITDVELGLSFERAERGRRGDRPWLADTLWASAEAGALAAPSLRPREKLPTDSVIGPSLALELPIFDQNQAQIARAALLHQAAQAERAALLLEVTQETRAAVQRAETAWQIADYYRNQFLPLAQTNLELGREAYRAGNLSLLAVLEAQKALLSARSRYVEALRDSATALADLERAVGLPAEQLLREGAESPSTRPATAATDREVQQ